MEFNAARRVGNRLIFVRRPNENTIQMFRPDDAWTKVRRPLIGFRGDHDPVVERRIVGTAVAHICFGNVARGCDPFTHQRTLVWRQHARWEVANRTFHWLVNCTDKDAWALIQINCAALLAAGGEQSHPLATC
jgi:hypothetical protein